MQEISSLEGAFSTKYFIVDKITGSMMGIYNDKVEVEVEPQIQKINLAQLQHVVAPLEQRCQGFDASSIGDPQREQPVRCTCRCTRPTTRQQTPIPNHT